MARPRAEDRVLRDPVEVADWKAQARGMVIRYWAEFVVVALAVALWAPRISGPIDLRWDAGVYYILGTSLAQGHGYRILSEPGSPEALQYPPLLPAIVAIYQRALGTANPEVVAPWLRISYAALFLFYGLATLALARRYLRVAFAVIAVALSLLQVDTLFVSDLLFTEIPFALVSVFFVLVTVDGPLVSRPWMREALSFVLAAAGFLLRTAGIVLLAAWILEALVRCHWRLVLTRGLLAMIPVLAWQINVARVHRSYEYTHPAYEYQRAPYLFYNVSYAENIGLIDPSHPIPEQTYVRALVSRLTTNVRRMGRGLGEGISTSEFYWRELFSRAQRRTFGRQIIPVAFVIGPILVLSALVIAGVVILVHRRAWLMTFIVLGSVGLICTTPWSRQFQRYLMPLTPFLAIAAVLTLLKIKAALHASKLGHATRMVGQIAVAGLVAVPLILETYTAAEIFYQRQRDGATFVAGRGAAGPHFFYPDLLWRGWEQSVAWIEEHSAPDAIVATPHSHLCYLRTGRRAVSPPVEFDPARARHLLEEVPVSYVIVDRGCSLPAVEGNPPGWHLVQCFDGTRIYEHSGSLNTDGAPAIKNAKINRRESDQRFALLMNPHLILAGYHPNLARSCSN